MKKRIARVIAVGMLLVAIGFVWFALGHPEFSWPWSNTVSFTFYGLYLAAVLVLAIAPWKEKQT